MALCAAHPLKNQTMHTTSIKEIRKTQTQSHTHHYSIRNRASYIFHRSAPQFHIPNPKIESQFLNILSMHPSCVSHHIIAQRRHGEGKRRPYLDLPDSRPQFRPLKSNAQPKPNFWTKLVRGTDFFLSSDPPVFLYLAPNARDVMQLRRKLAGKMTQPSASEWWWCVWYVCVMWLGVSIPHVLAQWVGMANAMTTWIEGCAFCWW